MINVDEVKRIRDLAKEMGMTTIAVYNDIEEEWYYFVGEFVPKNPSSHIHFNTIRGKCINYIIENKHVYFAEGLKTEAIRTKIEDLPKEDYDFDFRFVWLK